MTQSQTGSADSACIYLCYSASRGVTAFTGGKNYRWAGTALHKAGFVRLSDGTYSLAQATSDATREALLDLTRLARTHRTAITTLERPFLGDVAARVAQHLPGDWSSEIVVHCVPVWQQDHLDWLWDQGALSQTLITKRVPYAALLTNGTDELLMIERPGHEQLLIGAYLPTDFNRRSPDNRHFSKTPYAPNSICVPAQPLPAAHAVITELLPRYAHAVHRLRTERVADALSAGQRALDAWDAVSDSLADEQGWPLDDETYGLRAQRRDAEVWDQFEVFLDHGPALIGTVTKHLDEVTDQIPRGPAEQLLGAMRGVLERGRDAIASWRENVSQLGDQAFDDAVAERNADVWDAMVTWLARSPDFIKLARSAAPSPASSIPAPDASQSPALNPAAPTAARTALTTRRGH
ncbi:hypothetical protein ACFY0R_10105 [Streptomyces sp. NPDC001633]|uniref:hypothetical protein n=1 Tax=Streptomyces sp. NPDC001633 TaxID=3364595 RepID=UPI0036836D28